MNNSETRWKEIALELVEAANAQQECGIPEGLLYGSGYCWIHPDGRKWTVPCKWHEEPPHHPLMAAAIAKVEKMLGE